MGKLILILCFSCLFFFVYPSELQYDLSNENDALNQAYDIKHLVRKSLSHFQNAQQLKSQSVHIQIVPAYKNFLSQALANLLENSTQCFRDLLYVAENLNGASGQWAMKMLDSYGKPSSGILEGMLNWVGEYTECTQAYAPPKVNTTTGNFHGQYCSLALSANVSNLPLSVTSGVCLPDTCSASEFQGDIATFLLPIVDVFTSNGTNPSLNVTLTCRPTHRHLNTPAKAVIALMSLFCALAILGSSVTVVKYFLEREEKASGQRSSLVASISPDGVPGEPKDREDSEDELLLGSDESPGKFYGCWRKCEPFLNCFCVFRNGAKLLDTSGVEGELLCIHGIRFLSMSWVILGHTYAFCFSVARNLLEAVDLTKNFPFQILLQAFFSVDSFFVLSGFLLTFLYMREFAKNEKGISWPYFYIHRYIRLTPVYMVVLGFSATVYLYLGSGPFWPDNDLDPVCTENWWWNLLYINNFREMSQQCMAWSWYLANDMQFFVISPLFLITLWRWPRVGWGLVTLFLFACWVVNFVLTYHFDLMPGVATLLDHPIGDVLQSMARFTDYFTKLYIKPYTRIAPYLIGMLTGYILFARKRSNSPKHSRVFLGVGWTVASVTTLVCVYGLYHRDPSLVARSFYNALSRTTFAVGLSWVIYVCLVGQGGFVNSLLSFRMFLPLSRLTYSAYLIHPMIIGGYYASLKTLFEFSHPTVVFLFLGVMVVTYGISLPVALVFESPIIALEKLVRSHLARKRED